MNAPTFSARFSEASTQTGAIELSKAVPLVESYCAPTAGVDFQINRAPPQPESDPNKFRHQKRADASLSKFRKHVQLFNPAARSAMLDSEKRATERDADRSFVFLE